MKSWLRVAVVGACLVLGPATPALADPATPTNYLSEVTDVDPPTSGLDVAVVGGDSFLQVVVTVGIEVEIPGYQQEPYLRIDSSGIVWANRNSPAFHINNDRFGRAEIPEGVSPEAPVDWVQVGSSGSYAWHDHRIHWMSPVPPPGVVPTQASVIQEWTIPLVVQGEPAMIHGKLTWVPSLSPLLWIALTVILAAAISRLSPLILLSVAALIALTFGLIQAATSPIGTWSEMLSFAPPLVGFALLPLGFNRERPNLTWQGTIAVLLAVWTALRFTYFSSPILPVPIPATAARAFIAATMGATLAAVYGIYRDRHSQYRRRTQDRNR